MNRLFVRVNVADEKIVTALLVTVFLYGCETESTGYEIPTTIRVIPHVAVSDKVIEIVNPNDIQEIMACFPEYYGQPCTHTICGPRRVDYELILIRPDRHVGYIQVVNNDQYIFDRDYYPLHGDFTDVLKNISEIETKYNNRERCQEDHRKI